MPDPEVEAMTAELTNWIENSWHRFCRGLDAEPEMWPASIRMKMTVRPDSLPPPFLASTRIVAMEGDIYPATSNTHGAVCAVVDGELLGLKPAEFEIETWATERPSSREHDRNKEKADEATETD